MYQKVNKLSQNMLDMLIHTCLMADNSQINSYKNFKEYNEP